MSLISIDGCLKFIHDEEHDMLSNSNMETWLTLVIFLVTSVAVLENSGQNQFVCIEGGQLLSSHFKVRATH